MMKEKLFYLLPLLALASCGEPSYKDASLSPERRAELLVKELTLEEKAHLMMDGSRSVERLEDRLAFSAFFFETYMQKVTSVLRRIDPNLSLIHI